MAGKNLSNKDKPKQSKVVRKKKARGTPDSSTSTSLSRVAVQKNTPAEQKPTLLMFTLQVLYKNLYILGILILRRKRRYAKRIKRGFARVKGQTYSLLERFSISMQKLWRTLFQHVKAPFARNAAVLRQIRPTIEAAKQDGKIPASAYLTVFLAVLKLIFTVLKTAINYLAPIAAAWLLIFTVNVYLNQPLGLAVIYNGQNIGYIQNESEFEEAVATLRERFIDAESSSLVGVPEFVLVGIAEEGEQQGFLRWLANTVMRLEVVEAEFTKVSELANHMAETTGGRIEWAYGLYIDNQFYGAVTDFDYLYDQLEEILSSNYTGYPDEKVEFEKKISVNEGLYPLSSIVSLEQIGSVIHDYETVDQIYVTQAGDSPTLIASKNGVPYDQVKSLNPGIEEELYIGQEIVIAKARPFLSVKNIYTMIYEEEYDYPVEETESNTFAVGHREILQEGEDGLRRVTARVTAVNGLETEREITDIEILMEAVPQRVLVGTNVPTAPSGGGTSARGSADPSTNSPTASGFMWPTVGGRATTYAGHSGNGVDIARPAGTPIYASRSGTVSLAINGYSGYGRYVKIDHGDGYETLYAHASELAVSPGQYVNQGDVIGYIGRTGWATGNHVHFEIIYYGSYQYPVNYIGSYG